MSESTPDIENQAGSQPAGGVWQPPAEGSAGAPIPAQYGQAPPQYGQPAPYGYAPVPQGPPFVGTVRSTGTCILLFFVTLGIYGLYWYYSTHDEMKRHSGNGIGGGLALVLAIFVGVASPFLNSSEVGQLYERRGQAKPVTGATGLWYIPGCFILVGPFIWFAKTNGALNDYWRSLGAS